MNAYRQQQLAIQAAIERGDFEKASDLLRQDIRTFANSPPKQSKPKQKSKLLRILCRLLK